MFVDKCKHVKNDDNDSDNSNDLLGLNIRTIDDKPVQINNILVNGFGYRREFIHNVILFGKNYF